jgi:hypothetical protein
MIQYDIMHEHDNYWNSWPPLPDALYESKMYRYVAIIEGFNHSLERVPRDYTEITLFRQCKEDREAEEKTIPTSREISLFIIAFL